MAFGSGQFFHLQKKKNYICYLQNYNIIIITVKVKNNRFDVYNHNINYMIIFTYMYKYLHESMLKYV